MLNLAWVILFISKYETMFHFSRYVITDTMPYVKQELPHSHHLPDERNLFAGP